MERSASDLPRVKSERVNIRVTEKNKARLSELVEMSRASTMTEVVTKALAVLEMLLRARRAGKAIVVRAKGEPDREIELI